MADRAHELLVQLERHDSWTKAAVLAEALCCTTRTVKSTVAALNERYPGIIVSSSQGYRMGDPELADRLLSRAPGQAAGVPQTAQERRARILCQLLMRHRERSVYDLAEELCISAVTLENEVRALNAELDQTGVAVRIHGGALYVSGDEGAKKRVITDLLFSETRDFFNQLELVNEYFPDLDIKGLRSEIDAHLKCNGYYINGYSMSNLILHLAIALERTLHAFPEGDVPRGARQLDVSPSIECVANEVVDAINRRCGVELSPADRRAFSLILSTCLVETDELSSSCLPDERAARILEHICARVEAEYAIDLSSSDFTVRFALHVENLLARGEREVVLRNPQFGLIKNTYPYVYEIAVFIAQIIQDESGNAVSEDEIAFIALHVGCFIEDRRSRNSKLSAVLVSPRYNGRSELFARRLEETFPQDVKVTSVIEDIDDAKLLGPADFIVSTQEIKGRFGVPVIRISPYLGEMDRAVIQARIDAIRGTKRRKSMERNLHTFFRQDLFFVDSGFKDEFDCIEVMGGALVDGGFALPDFKDRLYIREAISSSVYRDIALPHPMDMDARRTAVAVSLHPEPISWKGEPVYAVLMLSVTRADRSFFREVFEFMAHVLNEPGSAKGLSRARTFDEFVETLLKYY